MSASARKSFWRYENFIVIAMFLGYGVIMMDRLTLAFLFPFALKETAPASWRRWAWSMNSLMMPCRSPSKADQDTYRPI